MRCNICDKQLSEKEIVWNKDLKGYEPCTICLDIAMEAAYSDGFEHEDSDGLAVVLEDTILDESGSEIREFYNYRYNPFKEE